MSTLLGPSWESRADFEAASSRGHTCAPPYIATCRACDYRLAWEETDGGALQAAYEDWLASLGLPETALDALERSAA